MQRYTQAIKDDSPISSGSHDGVDSSAYLQDRNGNFKRFAIPVGNVCYNTTQVTNGAITEVGDKTLVVDHVTWDNGDGYEVYATDTKNQILGVIGIDRRYGRKVLPHEIDDDGFKPEDRDLDEDWIGIDRPWGPGQPRRK